IGPVTNRNAPSILDLCLPCTISFTKHAMKQFPIQQLKILYNKYGTRNNKVKSLIWATRNRVHMPWPSMLLPLYYDIPVGAKRLHALGMKVAPVHRPRPRCRACSATGQLAGPCP